MARLHPKVPRRFNQGFIILHWIMALFIVCVVALGFLIEEFPKGSPERLTIFTRHMTFGISILLLVLARTAWRATHAVPPEPATLPRPMRRFARATHYLLYALMLCMPLVGWMMVSSRPRPDNRIDLALGLHWPQIPGFAERFGDLRPLLNELHWYGAWTLIVLVSLHAVAALFHHLVLRDDVLLRMVPQRLHPALHRLRGSVR